MIIDSHQHFWQVSRGDYGWLTPALKPLYKDFLPQDLSPFLNDFNIDGTVLVQAAPTIAETEFMLELAAQNSFIKGVVGWVDFEADDTKRQINRLSEDKKLVGLRPMIQDIDDKDWMLSPELDKAFLSMIENNLVFDALTLPKHLKNLAILRERYPDLMIVIDHASKPEIRDGLIEAWADDLSVFSDQDKTYCKFSGMVTEANTDWTTETLQPYVQKLLSIFGPQKLLWGSDWPVLNLASDYPNWLETSKTLIAHLSQADQDGILGQNAIQAYQLNLDQN